MAEASPVDLAARALARRDRCTADLIRILRQKGVAPDDAAEAVAALTDRGVVDDERFAAAAAQSLANRGYGDRAIAFRLQREGVERELAADAISLLELESERATRFAERRGASDRTVRWLTARGFARDSVEQAMGAIADSAAAELG